MSPSLVVFWFLVVGERLWELCVSRRNAAWSLARGGREFGREHYPIMVALHIALLAGCLVEPALTGRMPEPSMIALMGSVVLLCQAGRYVVIATLGRQWNTRVIVVPGQARIRSGLYRWLDHPNYVIVVIEGLALPLMFGAWITAVGFTLANFWLLKKRIACENAALKTLASGESHAVAV